MKVGELASKLNDMDKDFVVKVLTPDGFAPVVFCLEVNTEKAVVLLDSMDESDGMVDI